MTTIQNVRDMFVMLKIELPYRDGKRWTLLEGDRTNGRQFAIVCEDMATGGHSERIDLGWTKVEAETAMRAMKTMSRLATEE